MVLADNHFIPTLVTAVGAGTHWVLLTAVFAALVLGVVAPEARPRLRAAVLLIAASALGTLLWATLLYRGANESSGYRWIHFAGQLCLAIALINLGSVLLFRVVLASIR